MDSLRLRTLFEQYIARSCAFSTQEKLLLRASFPTMHPETQKKLLKALQKEDAAHTKVLSKNK